MIQLTLFRQRCESPGCGCTVLAVKHLYQARGHIAFDQMRKGIGFQRKSIQKGHPRNKLTVFCQSAKCEGRWTTVDAIQHIYQSGNGPQREDPHANIIWAANQ